MLKHLDDKFNCLNELFFIRHERFDFPDFLPPVKQRLTGKSVIFGFDGKFINQVWIVPEL